ncbi:MAG: hypothetical protein JWP87_1834 [Labilithrix sp.]|nr:hypothetical protein [Labilithrix sp.]
MAAIAERRPSGKVTAVYERTAEREAAYDFLENEHVKADAVAESLFQATAARVARESTAFAYVTVDGTTLSLADHGAEKGFGPIGSGNRPTRGLCVMSAYAVSNVGVPLGLLAQHFWARTSARKLTRKEAQRRSHALSFEDKEPFHFVSATREAMKRLDGSGIQPWIVIDREGDNRDILAALSAETCTFTIRARGKRKVRDGAEDADANVRAQLAASEPLCRKDIELPRHGGRAARHVTFELRARVLNVQLKHCTPRSRTEWLPIGAVSIRETSESAGKNEPLDWILYTNALVSSAAGVLAVLASYCARWRIEEFHRTWKSGECDVEDTQLASIEGVRKWATILAAVAGRIERLKYLARHQPDAPASLELSPGEIEGLKLDRIARTPARHPKLPVMPSMVVATEWIAELGGWIRANGPPGSITLSRGLERLRYIVDGVELARRPTRET